MRIASYFLLTAVLISGMDAYTFTIPASWKSSLQQGLNTFSSVLPFTFNLTSDDSEDYRGVITLTVKRKTSRNV